ncbi:hypothetical protein [endosymbiont of Ridgeia piscesae]|jgi:hypothetical protein|uniref:Uncharacterized protein n=1 Tax=endosymbiont of Ridgeia piscesae TaxID=54398 RepID=A0A0T5Z0M3_9GAMM|nr:hypothetical protein [endosymbiont of Ridgeia piscesae]KRT56380.1 hypothetical protein Ga0074115_1437 [endosymbiont of Ridgeia piscesae]KRT59860.1 hypothetical protein Ga0076813_16212 [endosymbiont of Ridgeia piscesae]
MKREQAISEMVRHCANAKGHQDFSISMAQQFAIHQYRGGISAFRAIQLGLGSLDGHCQIKHHKQAISG